MVSLNVYSFLHKQFQYLNVAYFYSLTLAKSFEHRNHPFNPSKYCSVYCCLHFLLKMSIHEVQKRRSTLLFGSFHRGNSPEENGIKITCSYQKCHKYFVDTV